MSILVVVFPSESFSHQDGCHRWHSCPSDSGSYVCGDLGYTSECPSYNSQPKESKPTDEVSTKLVPSLTTKDPLSLKEQLKRNTPMEEIMCRNNLELMLKNNGNVVCVSHATMINLVERNWGVTK